MSNMETLRCPSCGCAERLCLIKKVEAQYSIDATLDENGRRWIIEIGAPEVSADEEVLIAVYCNLCSWELTVDSEEEALGYLSAEPDPDTYNEEDES